MICTNCRQTLLSRFRTLAFKSNVSVHQNSSLRYASTVPATPNAAPAPPTGSIGLDQQQSPSEPHAPSSATAIKETKTASKPKSSIPGGTELRGLGYTKAKSRVLAMEDDQYPEWLWTLLDNKRPGETGEKVDLAAMTKKQRHRYDKNQERLFKDIPKQIPLHEQSKDLTGPGDDALISLQRRQEITKSARAARRKDIRESNFLKSM